MEWSLSRQPIN